MTDQSKMIAFIAATTDASKLRALIENAKKKNAPNIERAAFRRLIELVPSENPGSVEHSLWQTIVAFEELLTQERGKTTRLARTRQKIARVGAHQTLVDWALSDKRADGFRMLIDRDLPELTGEAIVLKHQGSFSTEAVISARSHLLEAGVSNETIDDWNN